MFAPVLRLNVILYLFQDILAKRNQKPEVRKAQREQAIRAAKETKKTAKVSYQRKHSQMLYNSHPRDQYFLV